MLERLAPASVWYVALCGLDSSCTLGKGKGEREVVVGCMPRVMRACVSHVAWRRCVLFLSFPFFHATPDAHMLTSVVCDRCHTALPCWCHASALHLPCICPALHLPCPASALHLHLPCICPARAVLQTTALAWRPCVAWTRHCRSSPRRSKPTPMTSSPCPTPAAPRSWRHDWRTSLRTTRRCGHKTPHGAPQRQRTRNRRRTFDVRQSRRPGTRLREVVQGVARGAQGAKKQRVAWKKERMRRRMMAMRKRCVG